MEKTKTGGMTISFKEKEVIKGKDLKGLVRFMTGGNINLAAIRFVIKGKKIIVETVE